jgi:hypothetical protein
MAHDADKRAEVRALYVFKRLNLKQIASETGVSPGTIRIWKNKGADEGDDWDAARTVASLAGQGFQSITSVILESYLTTHYHVLEQIQSAPPEEIPFLKKAQMLASLADAFTKTMKAAGTAGPELNRLAIAQDIIKRFADFIFSEYPEHTHAFTEVLEPFGKIVAREYG